MDKVLCVVEGHHIFQVIIRCGHIGGTDTIKKDNSAKFI